MAAMPLLKRFRESLEAGGELDKGSQAGPDSAPLADHRQPVRASKRVGADRGQLVGRRLKDIAFVVHVDELTPVSRWTA